MLLQRETFDQGRLFEEKIKVSHGLGGYGGYARYCGALIDRQLKCTAPSGVPSVVSGLEIGE